MPPTPRDDYYAMMWTFSVPIFTHGPQRARLALERFRQMGCNGATCIATFVDPDDYHRHIQAMGFEPVSFPTPDLNDSPFAENGFPYYLENICRPIYEKWEKRKPLFRSMYEQFTRRRDRKVFVHPNCPNNPAVDAAVRERIGVVMARLAGSRNLALLYDLRDEPSITSFLLASDWCFCEHCLARIRAWLKGRYGELADLNREWETSFQSWDQVEPLTTQEALDRREAGQWNFAPWADHRSFMNESLARVAGEWADEIRKHDPGAMCGLEGTQCPSVFGGFDFSLLAPAIDWVEPYMYGGAADCLRSFKARRHLPILKTTGLGGDMKVREMALWHAAFQGGGDCGAIVWNSDTSLDTAAPDLPLKPEAVATGKLLAEMRTGVPRLLQLCDEVSSPVAVHYSHASLNADFITSVPNRWRSVAAWVDDNSAAYRCREAWWKLLEDRGLRPVFISARQVEAGELVRRGIKLFILPRSIAISDAEAAEMRTFVEAGGTLVADSFAGRMDEHCRERPAGVLDELFGVRRTETDNYHSSVQRASFSYDPFSRTTEGRRVPAPADAAPVLPRWGSGKLRATCSLIEDCVEPLDDAQVCGCTEMSDTLLGFARRHGKGIALLFNAAPLEYLNERRLGRAKPFQDFFGGIIGLAGVGQAVEVRSADDATPMIGWSVFPFIHGDAFYAGLLPDMGVTQTALGGIDSITRQDAGRPVTVCLPLDGHVYEARSGRYLGRAPRVSDELSSTSIVLYAVLPYKVDRMDLRLADGTASACLFASATPGEHLFRFDLFDAAGNRMLDAGGNVVAPAGKATWTPAPADVKSAARLLCRDVATGVSADVALR